MIKIGGVANVAIRSVGEGGAAAYFFVYRKLLNDFIVETIRDILIQLQCFSGLNEALPLFVQLKQE